MSLLWKNSPIVNLEVLHRSIDFQKMCSGSSIHQADLTARAVGHALALDCLAITCFNCEEICQTEISGAEICKDFLAMCPSFQTHNSKLVPKSRAYQVNVDLLCAFKDEALANELESKVWAAVADEIA